MITVSKAWEIVQAQQVDFGIEELPLELAVGRVLRENWYADRDLPAYDRVCMDGIAINAAAAKGQKAFSIEGIIAAGDPKQRLQDDKACFEIMTGAVLPHNCDSIIRYEDVEINDGIAHVKVDYKSNQSIHEKGQDHKKGDLLLAENCLLSPAEIGVGAAIGKATVKVSKLPKILVISSGNELVEIDQEPAPHQIRRGNAYRLAAILKSYALPVGLAHMNDDLDKMKEELRDYVDHFDVLLLTGGVSKGKYDFLPEALEAVGVEKHFHKVQQRPGKPFWFGTKPRGATVFAFPGNPVSSFMCMQVYFIDWLFGSLGLKAIQRPRAILTEDFQFKPDLTYFLEVKLVYSESGELLASPLKRNGSGDHANLLRADALIRLPKGQDQYSKGDAFTVYSYRNLLT